MTAATTVPDDQHGDDTETAELLTRAAQAERRRSYATNPNVVALAVDEVRIVIERTMWVGIVLGMAFTTASVQEWAAKGVEAWTLTWLTAWLLAPLVEVPLLAALRAEQAAARYGIAPTPLVRRGRWALLAAGYLLNTWGPWSNVLGGKFGWDKVLLHSIPPLAVLVAVEMLTDLRDMLTRAIDKAARAPRSEVRTERTRPAARPPVTPPRTRPSTPAPQAPACPEPTGEPEPDTPPAAPGVGTAREVATAWALAHWDDPDRDGPLRPLHVRAHMAAIGREISKGEASKVMTAARAERFRHGLSTGPRPVEDETSEENVG